MKNINQQTEKNEQNLNMTNTKKTIARNIIVKLLKTKDFLKKLKNRIQAYKKNAKCNIEDVLFFKARRTNKNSLYTFKVCVDIRENEII